MSDHGGDGDPRHTSPEAGEAPFVATVFMADASAEAERAAQALRTEGYHVLDVPLSLLFARVAAQRPLLVILDVDTEGGLDVLSRMREVPGGERIEVIFLGEAGRTFADGSAAIRAGASGFFARPIDISMLVRKVTTLVPIGPREADAGGTPPPSIPSARSRSASSPPTVAEPAEMISGSIPDSIAPHLARAAAALDSAPISSSPPASRSSAPMPPSMAPASLLDGPIDAAAWGMSGPAAVGTQLSEELARMLALAEERVGTSYSPSSEPPSPEEEVDAVLPAELLAALDEPIGFDDEEGEGSSNVWLGRTPGRRGATGAQTGLETGGGDAAREQTANLARGGSHSSRPPGGYDTPTPPPVRNRGTPTPTPVSSPTPPPADEAEETPRPPRRGSYHPEGDRAGDAEGSTPEEPPVMPIPSVGRPRMESSPPTTAMPGLSPRIEEPKPEVAASVVLTEGDALALLATKVAERHTGSLCFDAEGGLRRVVMRDGDLVTAGSSVEDETLLAFLGTRGELPKEVTKRLLGRLPPFGRHAGAALVAHGHLGQDRLWEVLRAHAEWIVGKLVALRQGTCLFEPEAPGRLRAEPSVFGGSTGAEVLVEVVRRVTPPTVAIQRLGGSRARLGEGRRRNLLGECALDSREAELVDRARGGTLGDAVSAAKSPDFASVLLALVQLGILETLAAAGAASEVPPPDADPLDEEAFRARVRARLDLVEEGDYFAVLGVAHAATPYEIKRAYLDLRRSFEPGRVLTAATADLLADVTTILEVLDEAFEVLRDTHRRDRYRRAIEGVAPAG